MTPDQMAELAARLSEKSARFRKHADFLLTIVPGDPINTVAANGLTADADDLDRAADLIERMAKQSSRHVALVCPQCHWTLEEREPLSDEQIRALVQPMDWPPSVTEIVRAVEQVHGIKGGRND